MGYMDLISIYPKPYAIALRGTIHPKLCGRQVQCLRLIAKRCGVVPLSPQLGRYITKRARYQNSSYKGLAVGCYLALTCICLQSP